MISARKFLLVAILIMIISSLPGDLLAQCAMCRAVAADGVNADGTGIASGINKGIMYIMAVPYILLATAGFIFFRKRIGGFLKEFSNIHNN